MHNTNAKTAGLSQLYADNFVSMYKLARHMLQRYTGTEKDAADVVQTVFEIAIRKWDMLAIHPNPSGWLLKATQLCCMNHVREHYSYCHKVQGSINELIVKQPKNHYKLYTGAQEDETAVQDILVALEQILDQEDYMILKSFCLDRRTISEISCETGLSENNLRVRIHRLRKNIMGLLELIVILFGCQNI